MRNAQTPTIARAPAEIREQMPSGRTSFTPTSDAAVLFLTTLLAVVLYGLAAATQHGTNTLETLGLAAICSLPFALIVRGGHLGRTRWELPSAGAFIFLMWEFGLGPSIIAVNPNSVDVTYFSDGAVTVSRVIFVVWFFLYGLALGPAPLAHLQIEQSRHPRRKTRDLAGFCSLIVIWSAATFVAARFNMLSAWGASGDHLAEKGSAESGGGLLYVYLAQIIVPVAVYARLVDTGAIRRLASVVMPVGFLLLFIYSQRRIWVAVIYLCIYTHFLYRRRLTIRWVAPILATGFIGLGPLVWAYREIRTSGSGEHATIQLYQSARDYFTRSDTRDKADGNSLALESRLNISSVLMGTVEYVLREGPNLSPSFLSGVLVNVPTFIWREKSDFAEPLKARYQLLATGHFLQTDLAVSPITEFTFQLGAAGSLGGALYGYLARLCTRYACSTWKSMTRFVIWASFVINLSLFDAGTDPLVAQREMLVLLFFIAISGELAAWISGNRRAPQKTGVSS